MSHFVLSIDALLYTELDCTTKTSRVIIYPTFSKNVNLTIMWLAFYVVLSYMVLLGVGWIEGHNPM